MQAISSPSWSGGDALTPGERLPLAVGEMVAGKYKVDQILGMGGMAVVAAATHVELGQRFALKVMRQPMRTPESVDRFLTEARAAVSLKSHHVAKVLDVGTLPSGLPYIVMELLEGIDFATILEREGLLRPPVAIEYILQACDAISEAHRLGIVHRDLKPKNLFLTHRDDGTPLVKVLDFGISKLMTPVQVTEGDSRTAVTHESTTLTGSPMYMSPEQVRSAKDDVDHRTDIWALGAILFELVTGHRAFDAPNVADIFVKVLEKPPPSIEVVLPNPPPGLSTVIHRCLEKDRKKRYATIGAFAHALSELSSSSRGNPSNNAGAAVGMPSSTSNIPAWDRQINLNVDPFLAGAGAGAAMPTFASSRTHSETFVLPGRRRSFPWRAMAIIALLIAMASGGGGFLYRHRANLRGQAQQQQQATNVPASSGSTSTSTSTSSAAASAMAWPTPGASPSIGVLGVASEPSPESSAKPAASGRRAKTPRVKGAAKDKASASPAPMP